MPEWRWSWLYQAKNRAQWARASSKLPNRSGKSGRYLKVRNCDSEYGLSLLTWGRLCDLVTPRSASRWATGLAIIGDPRSECMESWARSALASIQPTAERL